jgi:plasmid stabilization system protein ParE
MYAHPTVSQIIEEAESIAPNPRKGRKVSEYQKDGTREVFHHPYRIIYLVNDEAIEVLSVVHGARLLPDAPKL